MIDRLDLDQPWMLPAVLGLCLATGVAVVVNPAVGVAAAVGVAFVLLVLSNLTWGLVAFVLASFLDVMRSESGSMTFTKLAGLVLAVSWLANVVTDTDRDRHDFFADHAGFTSVLALFLGWVALSALWAEDAGLVLNVTQRYGLNILLLPIVFTAVRERRHVLWVIGAFVVGTLVSTAYGLLFPVAPDAGEVTRLGGAIGDSNETATVLVAAIVLSTAVLGLTRRSVLVSFGAVLAGLLALAGLFNTVSRTGLVSLGATILAGSLLAGRWRRYVVQLGVIAAVGTLAYFVVLAPLSVRDRVESSDSSGRWDLWTVAGRAVDDHPVRGVGAGNFQVASVHYLLQPGATARAGYIVDTPKVVHNIYLEVLAETGVVGLILFLSVPLFSLVCCLRAARALAAERDPLEVAARAVMISLIGVLVAGCFVSGQYSKQLWLLIALGPALLALSRRPALR